MPDDALTAQEEQAIFKGEIKKIIKTLNDKEKYLLQNRILGDPPLTLQEVGDYFGITRERARQLEERVIAKMREQLQKAFPDYQIKTPAED
jgi:RNA polymerase sigma-32 factor